MSDEEKPIKKTHGGPGRGGGRPKGSKTKSLTEMEKYLHKLLDKIVKERGTAPSALEMYQALYRDNKVPIVIRREAMNKALQYESGKVQPIVPPEDPTKPKPAEDRMVEARSSLIAKLVGPKKEDEPK